MKWNEKQLSDHKLILMAKKHSGEPNSKCPLKKIIHLDIDLVLESVKSSEVKDLDERSDALKFLTHYKDLYNKDNMKYALPNKRAKHREKWPNRTLTQGRESTRLPRTRKLTSLDNVADSEKPRPKQSRDESNHLPSTQKVTSLLRLHVKNDVTSVNLVVVF